MKFAHFSHVWNKPAMTAAERYDQLSRELAICDELGFDFALPSSIASILMKAGCLRHPFIAPRPQRTRAACGSARWVLSRRFTIHYESPRMPRC